MYARVTQSGLLVLLLLATVVACSDDNDVGVLTGPTTAQLSIVSAEPAAVRPETLDLPTCENGSPFGLRLVIVVGGDEDVVVQWLRFALLDQFGRSVVPRAISPLVSASTSPSRAGSLSVPTPGTVTFPSSSPVSIPGSGTADGLLITAGTRRSFPFFLEFGCEAPAAGSLVATVATTDEKGKPKKSEVRVRVGR